MNFIVLEKKLYICIIVVEQNAINIFIFHKNIFGNYSYNNDSQIIF